MGELLGGDKSLIKTKYLLTCAYKGQELERAHASLHAILGDPPDNGKKSSTITQPYISVCLKAFLSKQIKRPFML
jgi:hypothetical protein